jgi:tetratricopeptide (TPR) repeat protein
MSSRNLRYLFVGIALLLSAGLYFTPSQINNKPAPKKDAPAPKQEGISMEGISKTAKESLKDDQKGYISSLEMQLESNPNQTFLLDSLGKAWDEAQIPALSAWYFEKKAEKLPTEENYLAAAYRYFDAFKIAGDELLRTQLVDKAISSYSKVLEINPKNLNAKTDLGVCYAEGTSEPMKGILMLRDVIKEDPNHEMAQLNLGFLSVKSNQFDKAIDRFTTVMKINSKRTDVFYFLGHTYYESGKKDSAIFWLEKFKKESDDYRLVQQAEQIITQLKQPL